MLTGFVRWLARHENLRQKQYERNLQRFSEFVERLQLVASVTNIGQSVQQPNEQLQVLPQIVDYVHEHSRMYTAEVRLTVGELTKRLLTASTATFPSATLHATATRILESLPDEIRLNTLMHGRVREIQTARETERVVASTLRQQYQQRQSQQQQLEQQLLDQQQLAHQQQQLRYYCDMLRAGRVTRTLSIMRLPAAKVRESAEDKEELQQTISVRQQQALPAALHSNSDLFHVDVILKHGSSTDVEAMQLLLQQLSDIQLTRQTISRFCIALHHIDPSMPVTAEALQQWTKKYLNISDLTAEFANVLRMFLPASLVGRWLDELVTESTATRSIAASGTVEAGKRRKRVFWKGYHDYDVIVLQLPKDIQLQLRMYTFIHELSDEHNYAPVFLLRYYPMFAIQQYAKLRELFQMAHKTLFKACVYIIRNSAELFVRETPVAMTVPPDVALLLFELYLFKRHPQHYVLWYAFDVRITSVGDTPQQRLMDKLKIRQRLQFILYVQLHHADNFSVLLNSPAMVQEYAEACARPEVVEDFSIQPFHYFQLQQHELRSQLTQAFIQQFGRFESYVRRFGYSQELLCTFTAKLLTGLMMSFLHSHNVFVREMYWLGMTPSHIAYMLSEEHSPLVCASNVAEDAVISTPLPQAPETSLSAVAGGDNQTAIIADAMGPSKQVANEWDRLVSELIK